MKHVIGAWIMLIRLAIALPFCVAGLALLGVAYSLIYGPRAGWKFVKTEWSGS